MLLRRLIFSAGLAGLLAGLLVTLIQQIEVQPLLISAEALEAQHLTESHAHHDHSDNAHPSTAWGTRLLSTLAANILTAVGFAALLLAAIKSHDLWSGKNRATVASGLVWGMAGYLTFFVAPSLLLPPQTPASDMLAQHHGVPSRQLLWVTVVCLTAAGMALAYYGNRLYRASGLIMLTLPHLFIPTVAPLSPQATLHPADLRLVEHLELGYITSAAITNGLFWVFLGIVCAGLIEREYKKNQGAAK